jgi:parallel beta-helix repeat protein
VNDVRIENIVLDGDREHNEEINGNYAGAIFMQWCDRVVIEGVTCRNYNGDGISLQVCDDAQVLHTTSENNANLGLHPGSGCQRPVFRNCVSRGNGLGFFFCWGVRNGLVEDCTFTENKDYGVSYGHRDTDNLVRNCTITKNGKVGVLFRNEEVEYFGGHRNVLENCTILDNGATENGCGVDIRGDTHDLTFKGCTIGDTGSGIQKIGIRIAHRASDIRYEGCTFAKLQKDVEKLPPETPTEKK